MRVRYALKPYRWTSRPSAPPGYCNGDSCNIGTAREESWPDRGYSVSRLAVLQVTHKANASFVHKHTDGTEWPFYVCETAIFPETGSDSPSAIASGMTETFVPSVASMAKPAGVSVLLNGTNAQARLLRVLSGALEAVLLDMAAPATVTLGQSATGGNLSNGTHHVRITAVDDAGATTVESGPSAVMSITLNGGGSSQSITVPEPAGTEARVARYRYYLSSTTDTPAAFLRSSAMTLAKGAGTFTIAGTLASMTDPIASRNSVYRVAVMPLSAARWCCEHEGRLFIASESDNEVYFSERQAPNHWYSTNTVSNGAESPWSDGITGICSANGAVAVFTAKSIHRIVGTFGRDDLGDEPTYALDAKPVVSAAFIGCVGGGTVAQWLGTTYFMSRQGPCALDGNTVGLLEPGSVQWSLDSLDWAYAKRWTAAIDPHGGYYVLGVARLANSSRAMDGASVAGICDIALRWDILHGLYATPLRFGDFTHLSTREDGGRNVSTARTYLCATGPYGHMLRLGSTWNGGAAADVSGTTYDGKLATANTTTTAAITLSGITDQALVGRTVMLYYPAGDSAYPGVWVLKTVKANTTTAGTLTITWAGALTVPSGTRWTVRIGGLPWVSDVRHDPLEYVQAEAGSMVQLHRVTVEPQHVVGAEAVS